MAGRVAGKVAVVVGGGQAPGATIGNGRATAIVLAREGAKVRGRRPGPGVGPGHRRHDRGRKGATPSQRTWTRPMRVLWRSSSEARRQAKAPSTSSTTTSGRASRWATPWLSI